MSESVTAPADAGGEQHDAPASAPIESQAPAPQTIRDTMAATLENIEARDRDGESARGPDGRFASAEQNDGKPAEAATVEPLAPPEGFSDKAQVDWNRLPRSVQEGILARAAAVPAAPPPDAFVETARNLRGAFEQHGLIPERALPEIVGAWQQLVANPREVLPALAKQFGVEWGAPAATQQQPNAQTDRWVDPDVQALRAELAELKASHQERNRQDQARAAAEESRLTKSTMDELSAFAKGKSDFDALRPEMAALMKAGRAKDLAEAYEMAGWANPQTRAARIEAERKAEVTKRQEEAERARRAAAVNVRSDSRVNPAPARNLRETMERTYDAIQSA